MPKWSISKLFDPAIGNRVWVRAARRYFFRGSLKINGRKLFDQPFAQHLTQAQRPIGGRASLRIRSRQKRSYREACFTDSLALGSDRPNNGRNPTVGPGGEAFERQKFALQTVRVRLIG